MMNRTQINKFLPKEDIPKLVIFILFGLMILGNYLFSYSLNRHTIGVIKGYSKDVNGYKQADYDYNVNGVLHRGHKVYEKNQKPEIGGRYYVSFSDDTPLRSRMHLDRKPVPESIQPPEGGWVGDFDSLYIVHRKELF